MPSSATVRVGVEPKHLPDCCRMDAEDFGRLAVPPPDAVERDYRQYLLDRLARLRSRVSRALDRFLTDSRKEAMDERARQDSLRADASEGTDVSEWIERTANVRMGWERDRDVERIRERVERVGAQADAFNRSQQRRVFQDVIGIDPADNAQTKDLLDRFAVENVDLITGQDKLEDRALTQLQTDAVEALRDGVRHEEFARRVQERLDVAESRARLIARDQVASLNGQLTARRHQAAGIDHFRWQSSEDERVRDLHEMLNGQVYSYKDPPSEGMPGEPINCRCVAIPVFDTEGEDVQEGAEQRSANTDNGPLPDGLETGS